MPSFMEDAVESLKDGPLETNAERLERLGDIRVCPAVKKVIKRKESLRGIRKEEPKRVTITALIPYVSDYYDPSINCGVLNQVFFEISKIGSGGLGDVFSAISKEDGEKYAIKKHTKPIGEDSPDKYKEARNFLQIPPHDNLLKYFGSWRDQGHLYIQTELCLMDLKAFSKTRLDQEQLWNVLSDIVAGLNHMHSHGFLHCDLKTENIFVSKDGRFVIGDIGLAGRLDEEHAEGDPKYLAREVLHDKKATMASDVFSLGCVMLELATDIFLPVTGINWQAIRNGKIPKRFFIGVDLLLKELILMMLDADPDARPTCAALIEHPTLAEKFSNRETRIISGSLVSSPVSQIDEPCSSTFRPSCTSTPKHHNDTFSPPRKLKRLSGPRQSPASSSEDSDDRKQLSATPTRSQRSKRTSLRDSGIKLRSLDETSSQGSSDDTALMTAIEAETSDDEDDDSYRLFRGRGFLLMVGEQELPSPKKSRSHNPSPATTPKRDPSKRDPPSTI